MLGSFNSWNIIKVANKFTSIEDFYAVHKAVLYDILDNMAYLAKLVKYDAIKAADPTTMVHYEIKDLSKLYKLQEDQNKYIQVSKSG